MQRPRSPVADNDSTGSSSLPEELSVRTPLLELDAPPTVQPKTNIKVSCIYVFRFFKCFYVPWHGVLGFYYSLARIIVLQQCLLHYSSLFQ